MICPVEAKEVRRRGKGTTSIRMQKPSDTMAEGQGRQAVSPQDGREK